MRITQVVSPAVLANRTERRARQTPETEKTKIWHKTATWPKLLEKLERYVELKPLHIV